MPSAADADVAAMLEISTAAAETVVVGVFLEEHGLQQKHTAQIITAMITIMITAAPAAMITGCAHTHDKRSVGEDQRTTTKMKARVVVQGWSLHRTWGEGAVPEASPKKYRRHWSETGPRLPAPAPEKMAAEGLGGQVVAVAALQEAVERQKEVETETVKREKEVAAFARR